MSVISPMQLEAFAVRTLEIATQGLLHEAPPADSDEEIAVSYSVLQDKSRPKFLLMLSVKVAWPAGGVSGLRGVNVSIEAVYGFPEDATEELIESFLPVHALANAWSTLRGVLASATGLCASGPYSLPIVNMVQFVKDAESLDDGKAFKGTIRTGDGWPARHSMNEQQGK